MGSFFPPMKEWAKKTVF